MSDLKGYRDLIVFRKAYKLAMDIFEITKAFPKEEIAMIGISYASD